MKQFIKFFIALAAMTVSTTSAWGQTKEITYLYCNPYSLDFSETSDYAEPLTSSSNSISISGWYYVEGNVTISGTVTLTGDTEIILCDGATLTIDASTGYGIYFPPYALSIYAQSSGSHAGKLIINSGNNGISGSGSVTINGGIISVTSTSSNGITCSAFFLNGGVVTAVGSGSTGVGIYASTHITINGGTLSATGNQFGMSSGTSAGITINGGQVTAQGDDTGINAYGDINLGWTNASDFIKSNSYNKLPTPTKKFNIEGDGTFESGIVIDKESLAGKKLTPQTDASIYTVTLAPGLSSNVEIDKSVAFYGERVAINVTPPTGKILASLTYYDGTNYHALSEEVNDYVITMPAHDVTVNATFVTPVAQIGDTKYANLASALADVKTSGTEITMIENSDESYLTGTVPGSHSVIINLNGKTVSINEIDVPSALTIKNGTLECSTLYTASVGFETELIFDNATVTITDELQWPSNNIILQGGANVTLHNVMWYAGGADSGDDGADFTIADNASKFTLVNCTVSGYNKTRVAATMSQWVQPGKTLVVNGSTKNNLTLRRTWGIQLTNHLGKSVYETGVDRVTATFFDGGTTAAPNPETFNPADYPEANAVVEIDNSDGKNHYVIVHLVPTENYADGYYWTDPQLIRALDYGGALSRAGSPTIELGEKLTLLKRDTYMDGTTERTYYNGAGWYYYKLDKDHSVAKGYTESALEGFAPQRFILGENNVTQSSDLKTVTATTDGWSAEILFDPATLDYTFDGSERTPVITSITVKNGSNVMATLTDAEDIANQITVGSKHTIGNTPLELGAGMSWFDHNLNDASVAHFIISVPLSVADDSAPKGTSANPWLVKTVDDMNLFSLCVNWGEYEFTNEWVKLNNNITYDATTSENFKPVGYSDYTFGKRFLGSFDGNYCVISGLEYVSDFTIPHFVGLFGNVAKGDGANDVAPTIINLSLSECSFTGGNEYVRGCGALAGFLSNGTVRGVAVQGCTVTGSVKSPQSYVGGVVGAAEKKARIYDCAVDMNNDGDRRSEIINEITDASLGYSNCTGGIIGYAHTCEVDYCAVADATIKSVTPAYATGHENYTGGVVGNSYVSSIHDNRVIGTTEVIDELGVDADNYVAAILGFKGNSIGDGSGGTQLKENYYDKAVIVSYKNSTMTAATTLNGYVKRGFRDIVIEESGEDYIKTKDEYVDITEGVVGVNLDDPSNPVNIIGITDGAKMWVFPATIDLTAGDGRSLTFDKKTPGDNCYAIDATKTPAEYSYAPGDVITLTATYKQTLDDGRTFYDQLSISGEDGNGDAIVITPAVATLAGGTYTQGFSFEMPVEEATVTATIAPSDWFTIDTNQKPWMSFYHEWTTDGGTSQTPVDANYAVTDPDGVETISAMTITGADIKSGDITTGNLNSVSYSGMPTLFYCANKLPAKLKFTPVADASANVRPWEKFKGVTADKDMSGFTDVYVLNGIGDFYRTNITTDDHTLKAHRCYIDLGNIAGVPARLHISGEATGIDSMFNVQYSMFNGPWYSLDGRKLDGKPTRKGIYINGGRKVIIK